MKCLLTSWRTNVTDMAIYVIVEDKGGIDFEDYHVSCLFSLVRGFESLKI
jgi:hypothetical protein